MSTKIATASVCNQAGLDRSIEYSGRAGRDCIDKSQIDESEIGLLLNIGIYRDSNIHEPALAALIQGRMGLNDSIRPAALASCGFGTLSLDLMNGVCGFFNAVQLATSYIDAERVRAVLVVASDVHPSGKPQADFPYDPLGAAALLTRSNDGSGFRDVMLKASDDDYIGSSSYADITKPTGARGALEFETDGEYAERLTDFAVASATSYVEERSIDVAALKYVLVATHGCDLRPALTKSLGTKAEQFLDVSARYGAPFTSLPIVGYHLAAERGLDKGDRLLFLAAGAGLTFASGVYEV